MALYSVYPMAQQWPSYDAIVLPLYSICVMMTERKTIEGGQKKCPPKEPPTFKKRAK